MYLHLITITLLAAFFAAVLIGAIITPTLFSTEMNLMPPQTQNYTPIPPQVYYGRVRTSFFRYISTGAEAQSVVIGLALLPKGARVLTGALAVNGALGANVQLAVGMSARDGTGVIDAVTTLTSEADPYTGLPAHSAQADSNNFFGTLSPANAAMTLVQGAFATTAANGHGYVMPKDTILTVQIATAAVTSGGNPAMQGYITYVVD